MSLRPGQPLDTILDVRVDDHADPLSELGRLCVLGEAHREHERGLGVLAADPGQALVHWTRAATLAPGQEELRVLALRRPGVGRMLLQLFQASPGWRTMLARLPAAGLLPDDRACSTNCWLRDLLATSRSTSSPG